MYDVAARAEVSHQTVSRVINGRVGVADDTRKRVLEAVRELRFEPNQLAQSLRRRWPSDEIPGSSFEAGPFEPDGTPSRYASRAVLSERAPVTGGKLATVVTLMPSGHPHAQLSWIDIDGEVVLVNTEPDSTSAVNAARDPRLTVLVHAVDDPLVWVEIRGVVADTYDGQRARSHYESLAERHRGHRGPALGIEAERVVLIVRPSAVNSTS